MLQPSALQTKCQTPNKLQDLIPDKETKRMSPHMPCLVEVCYFWYLIFSQTSYFILYGLKLHLQRSELHVAVLWLCPSALGTL